MKLLRPRSHHAPERDQVAQLVKLAYATSGPLASANALANGPIRTADG